MFPTAAVVGSGAKRDADSAVGSIRHIGQQQDQQSRQLVSYANSVYDRHLPSHSECFNVATVKKELSSVTPRMRDQTKFCDEDSISGSTGLVLNLSVCDSPPRRSRATRVSI
jgi:hypothetical protein